MENNIGEKFFFFFKYGTLHEFARHPCAGSVLVFSVSFQFLVYVLLKQALEILEKQYIFMVVKYL